MQKNVNKKSTNYVIWCWSQSEINSKCYKFDFFDENLFITVDKKGKLSDIMF